MKVGKIMLEFVKNMLEYAATKNGINYNKMQEYCKMYASDRRYKPYFAGATCSSAWNESGFIVYRGMRYYYRQNGENSVIVEKA